MKKFWLFRFWLADKRHRAWKQLELFSSTRKIRAVQDMHVFWQRAANFFAYNASADKDKE